MKFAPRLPALLVLLLLAGPLYAQRTPIAVPKPIPGDLTPRVNTGQCGSFTGHFGPLDYRTADPRDKRVVEEYHFDMEIHTFLSGQVSGRTRAGVGRVAGGFQYVLKAFPNHPAALFVMEQLARKLNSEQPQDIDYPLECFYLRAFMIAPDDPVVRAMYGIYLANRDRGEEAIHNLDMADDATHAVGPLQYQIGLANVTLKRYDKAQRNALRARRMNFPLDALERQLRQAGKWDEGLALPANDLNGVDPEVAPTPAVDASAAAH